METPIEWTQWTPPYDPRQVDGATVTEDEHGRWIETADCGQRCPGCGICCAGYHDVITAEYAGEEEFMGNLELARGGLAQLEGGLWYRVSACGESCPGYGRCCRPFGQRQRPETVADARRALLEEMPAHAGRCRKRCSSWPTKEQLKRLTFWRRSCRGPTRDWLDLPSVRWTKDAISPPFPIMQRGHEQ